jgi:hypothetical protein
MGVFLNKLFLAACAVALAVAGAAQASVQITVTPTLAPNAFGSPSFAGWTANELAALYTGQSSMGPAGTPTFYQAQSNVTGQQGIVTGFSSWMGQANSGGAYAGEAGNRYTFGVTVIGSGREQFSISELGFVAASNDAGDVLGFSYDPGPITGFDYSTSYMGVLYGADGKLGGGDDSFITGGADTQLVDAIIGRGAGNSLPAYCTGCTTAQEQQAIAAAANVPGLTQFTGTYYLDSTSGFSGSGTFNIASAAPEPTSWVILIAGLGGVGAAVRRRRAARAPLAVA